MGLTRAGHHQVELTVKELFTGPAHTSVSSVTGTEFAKLSGSAPAAEGHRTDVVSPCLVLV